MSMSANIPHCLLPKSDVFKCEHASPFEPGSSGQKAESVQALRDPNGRVDSFPSNYGLCDSSYSPFSLSLTSQMSAGYLSQQVSPVDWRLSIHPRCARESLSVSPPISFPLALEANSFAKYLVVHSRTSYSCLGWRCPSSYHVRFPLSTPLCRSRY